MITLTAGWIFKWLAPTPLPPRLTWQQQPGPGGSQTHTTHLASARLSCPHEVGQQQVSAVCHVTLGTTLVTLAQSTHVTQPRLHLRPHRAQQPIYWEIVVQIKTPDNLPPLLCLVSAWAQNILSCN